MPGASWTLSCLFLRNLMDSLVNFVHGCTLGPRVQLYNQEPVGAADRRGIPAEGCILQRPVIRVVVCAEVAGMLSYAYR